MSENTPQSNYPPRPPLPGPEATPQLAPVATPQVAPTAGTAFGYAAPSDAAHTPLHTPFNATAPTQPLTPYGSAPTAAPEAKVGAGRIVAIMVAAALIGGAAGIGGAAIGSSVFDSTSASGPSTPSVITVNNPDSVSPTTAIAAKVVPSVVTISSSSGSNGGTGSGVVLTADGYVVTNTHVVTLDGATADPTLSVTTSDGRVYEATVVGLDPIYDLAVIKLTDAEGLTPIEFGEATELNVGDQTVAVGAPLGLSNTVTTGIVSALNRSIQIASSAVPESSQEEQPQQEGPGSGSPFEFDFGQGQESQRQSTGTISIAVIQTDAAINPGNSGGALVDSEGKLIGINVAIASTGSSQSAAGSIGVGFSIPSDVVKRVTGEIIDTGAATHGLLGARVGNAAAQQGATHAGAYISEVSAGGAAAAAGLREGDVVTEFNGRPITSQIDLTAQVRALAAGSDADLTYVRDGKAHTATVTLGTLAP